MTPDIETQLSEMLEQKAATIQAADLSDRALDDALMLGEKISGPGRRAFALAAAVLLVAAVGATTFAARGHHVAHVTPVASQPDASDGTGQAQAWPFEAPQTGRPWRMCSRMCLRRSTWRDEATVLGT